MHTHAGAVTALRQYAASPLGRFGPDDVVAGIVPFAHMFGWVMLNSALRGGARMVTLARFELDAFLRMVQDHRVTAAAVVPPIARALARHPAVDRYDLSSLRFLLVGAAPCAAEIERECAARLGCVVGQGLGMTEAAALALPEHPACHGSVGRLVAGTQAVIVDPDSGARLGAGRTGELWVRGPQLMRGYLGDDAATAAEPGAIAAWLAERVAPYERLAEVVVDAIPRAPTGKLLRRVLVERERAAARPAASVA